MTFRNFRRIHALFHPRWHTLWRVAWLFIDFPMHARVVSCRRASGISAGCYFKSCQSPVIAPVFQWPEQDIVESSTEEGKHARVVSLPGERCTVKRGNDELRTCTSCTTRYATPWFDEFAWIFLAWIFLAWHFRTTRSNIHLAFPLGNRSVWHTFPFTHWYSYLCAVRDWIASSISR